MPKSSRTRRTPISFSASSEAIAVADSSTRTLSVISSRRWTGSRPVRATISATVAGRSRWATWRAERLTATSNGRASGRCSCQLEDLAAGALLDPAADRLDQAAVLGDRDELGRVEQAALGVLPADQRLEAGDLAGAQVDHRLVVEGELLAVERVPQLPFDLQPAHRAGPHLGVEEDAAGAAALLGPVHRRVGVADQQLGVGAALVGGAGDGDADAGGDEMLDALHREGLGEGQRRPGRRSRSPPLRRRGGRSGSRTRRRRSGRRRRRAAGGRAGAARRRAAGRRRHGGRGCR